MYRVSSLFLTVFLIGLILGCSGSGNSPVSPDIQDNPQGDMTITDPGMDTTPGLTGQNDIGFDHSGQASHMIWGLYEFRLDPELNTLEIVPLRSGDLHLNALKFLEPDGTYGLVQLASDLQWNADKTQLDLDLRLVHPFPNHPQFTGFDVKGIIITKGTVSGFSDPDLVTSGTSQLWLMNPDGYTRWWNPREFIGDNIFAYRDGALGAKDTVWQFEATLNGYKTFCDTLDPNEPVEDLDQSDRAAFRNGQSNIRHYTFGLTTVSDLVFNYAIDASWNTPLNIPPDIPGDFPPDANQPEPWAIVASETSNTLWYEASTGNQGGELILQLDVYDWQNPLLAPDGSVEEITVEWPGLFAPTTASFITDAGDHAVYGVTLVPEAGALTSDNPVHYMIYAESTDGTGYGGKLPGVPLVAAARFISEVSSEIPNTPPSITDGVSGNASPGLVIEQYTVTATDPDVGDVLTYMWSVEALGDPYNFDDPGNGDGTIDIDWSIEGAGEYTVHCQVDDGVNPPVDATPLDVNVGNTPPEVSEITGPTDVSAADIDANYSVVATDPDTGQTLTYMWSFVPNGEIEDFSIPGDAGDGSLTIDYSTVDPGLYDINVEVSDGFAQVTSTPITVTHNNTAPVVGEVTGKTPVTSLDTDEPYSAALTDPDTTQVHTWLWSVVPEGDPEDFTLPSNPDGSINLNWEDYSVGNWDVNVLVNDGIDQATGTKLTVTKENTPPSVGEVEGPNPVSVTTTDAQYSAPVADPDIDQVLTSLWSIVPEGQIPSFTIPGEADLSVIVDWSTYGVGVYTVNIRVNDGFVSVDGTQLTVEVSEDLLDPIAIGAADPTTQTVCEDIHFYDDGSFDPDGGSITLYEWDWENDGTFDETGSDVYHAFDTIGTHYVQLRVTDDEGATDTLDDPIEITIENSLPVASGNASKNDVYTNEMLTLDGSASYDTDCGGEAIVLYEWDIENDGTFDFTGAMVDISYDTAGTFNVQLRVTDDEGATDVLDELIEINVTVEYFDPLAFAAADPIPQTVCEDVHFTDDGSYDPDGGSITLYEWDWENDGTYDESGIEAWHSWDVPGTYYVNFRVTDDEGATDTLDTPLEITIENALPTASANADKTEVSIDEVIIFDASASIDNDCGGNSIVQYDWDWENDGTFDDSGVTATHSYGSDGVYFVQLRVTDDEGGIDMLDNPIQISVEIEFTDPIAIGNADPLDGIICEDIHFFDDGSYDPDGGSITLYEWDFENDGTYDTTGPDVYHSYDSTGVYQVQLRVTDDEGATDTLDVPIAVVVGELPPVAVASADNLNPTICAPIQLDGSDSYDSDCGGDSIVLFEWDLDMDGTYDETGDIISTSFDTVGLQEVQLRVTDNEGSTDTLDIPLQINAQNALPTAAATADKYAAFIDEDINFNGSDSHDNDCGGESIVLWEWDWENDGTYDDTGQFETHSWAAEGTYYVQLRVTDNEGTTDTLNGPIEIQISTEYFDPIAFAGFDPDNQTVCEDVHFFDDGSYDPDGGSITLYEWDWNNDGTYDDTGSDVYHSFDTIGTHYVQLRVTDGEGATDTLDTPLEVHIVNALPTAVASADDYDVYEGDTINFDGSSSYDNDCGGTSITLYEWDWENDGTYDQTGSTPSHSYATAGTYYVQLRVTDDEGGTDTLNTPLEITVSVEYFDPIAFGDFDPDNQTVCEDVHFFDDGSYDPDGGSITLYEWDWNNDGTYDDTGSDVYHSFDTVGTHYVQLRVTDDEGATDTLDTPLEVHIVNALPTAVASADDYDVYEGDTINFDGTGSYDNDCGGTSITLYEWDWENDGTYDDTGSTPSHSYASAGTYYVQLRVTDDEGGTNTLNTPLEITVSVEYLDPIAFGDFDPDNQTVCEDVHFFDDGSYDPDGGSITLYEWDWNNDGTYDDTGSDVYHSFDTVGTHYVQLRVTDDEGATDTLDSPLEVHIVNALPTAVASADDYDVYEGDTINFDGTGSYDNDCGGTSITLYEWDWENDGTYDDTGSTPSHSYASAGTYYVQLRVTDDEGGTDTLNTPLEITVSVEYLDPIAFGDFDPDNQTVCEDVHFFDDGSYDPDGGSITLYEWDWNNDGTYDDTGSDVYHSFDTVGTHYVQLRVTDDEGATDTLDSPLEVHIVNALPTAVASADDYDVYEGDTINFDGSSSYDNDCGGTSITLYEWDWENDGTYDQTGATPSHSYATAGTYYVQLRVTDDEGGTDTLNTPLEITVSVEYLDPIAFGDFDPDNQTVCEDVHFFDDGSYDPDGGSITLYEWDWDNDGTYDDTGSDVYHAFDTIGTHYVQLRVTDDEGATDTLDTPLEVHIVNALPTAVASADDYDVYEGDTINFDGTGSYDNDCGGTSITLYEWDWENDGTYDDTGSTPSHSYASAGTYYVQLRVTDDEGGTDTLNTPLEITVSVEYLDPIAFGDFDPDNQTVCEDVHFFDDGSYDPDGGSITLYEWDWNNDGTYDDTGSDVYHAFDTIGTHYVQLRVTDDEGATDTLDTALEVHIVNALPTAVASADDYDVYEGDTINFDGTGSYDIDCGGASITLYEWDWENDGTYDDTGSTPSHSYATAGTYYVQLRVTDDEGGTDTLNTPLEITVSVEYFDPIAFADFDPDNQTVCEDVNFFDDGSYDPDGGSITLYEWDWNNDGTYDDTGSDVYHAFDTIGTHYVQLRVTDDEGATDTLDTALEVHIVNALPTAVASADDYDVYEGDTINFDGTGSYDNDCGGASITLYEWDWENDGTYDDTGSTPSHSYASAGTYYVQLRVTDDEGGTDTLNTPLEITVSVEYLDPIAFGDFDPDNQTVCEDVNFFDDGSYDPDGGSITLYEWDWNNDGTYDDTGSDVYHAFDTVGTHYVQLRVTDDEGATDTLDTALEVHIVNALPTAVASADDYDVNEGDTINFDGTGSYDNDCGGTSITLYEWDWENDGTYDDTGSTPSHSYSSAGTYYVQLRVTDDEGGTDTLNTPLEITVSVEYLDPIAFGDFDPDNQTVCEDVHFFDDGSYDPDGGSITLYEWDWNNDGTYDDTGSDVYHAFDTVGTHYVQLRVTDDEGATDTLDTALEVHIVNALPTAVASADDYDVNEGDTINFDGTGSYDNDCGGTSITLYEWDWENDGTYDQTGATPAHSYSTAGTYFVQLRVTDDEGGTDTLNTPLEITVSEEYLDPIAYADFDPDNQTVCEDVHFFDDGSYDPDGGSITLYEWDWNNDGTYDDTGSDVYHSFDTIGTHYVQLRVTDDEGATDTLDSALEVHIVNALPTASATVDKTYGSVSDTFSFDGSASTDNDCGGDSITLYEWDFDYDGSFNADDTGATVDHQFGTPGVYDVQLRVTDDEGGIDLLDTAIEITITLTGCPTGLHSYSSGNPASDRGLSNGYSTFAYSVLPRAEIAFIESGTWEGQGLTQGGPNSIVTFDPDIDSDDPINDNIQSFPTGAPKGDHYVTCLDAAPYDGIVAVVTEDKPSEFRLLDTTVLVGNFFPFSYDFGGDARIMAIDFEDNGDLWIVVQNPSTSTIRLYNATYVGAPTYYTGISSTVITGLVGSEVDIFDLAYNWSNDRLYIFDAGTDDRGRVTIIDATSGTVYDTVTALFDSALDYASNTAIGIAGYADIEIDHMGTDETCHILLYGRLSSSSAQLRKYDEDMIHITSSDYSGDVWPTMTINPESIVTDRDIMLPGESSLGFWFAPSDY